MTTSTMKVAVVLMKNVYDDKKTFTLNDDLLSKIALLLRNRKCTSRWSNFLPVQRNRDRFVGEIRDEREDSVVPMSSHIASLPSSGILACVWTTRATHQSPPRHTQIPTPHRSSSFFIWFLHICFLELYCTLHLSHFQPPSCLRSLEDVQNKREATLFVLIAARGPTLPRLWARCEGF